MSRRFGLSRQKTGRSAGELPRGRAYVGHVLKPILLRKFVYTKKYGLA
jgi:hypothetical protein